MPKGRMYLVPIGEKHIRDYMHEQERLYNQVLAIRWSGVVKIVGWTKSYTEYRLLGDKRNMISVAHMGFYLPVVQKLEKDESLSEEVLKIHPCNFDSACSLLRGDRSILEAGMQFGRNIFYHNINEHGFLHWPSKSDKDTWGIEIPKTMYQQLVERNLVQ